jgi:uncharacterized Zn finger protein
MTLQYQRNTIHAPLLTSRRGAVGDTWWGRRFIDAMEKGGDQARLARGRSYARNGRVQWVLVEKDGLVARVIGSAVYQVVVSLPQWDQRKWEDVVGSLASEAAYSASLMAGEMPQNIEEIFQEAGLSLFPEGMREIKARCTCPDYGRPCKHTAAVLYLLGENIDRDPTILFTLRGKDRDDLLCDIRRYRAAHRADIASTDGQKDDSLAHYYSPGEGLSRISSRAPGPRGSGAEVLKELGRCPCSLGGKNLGDWVAAIYPRASRYARSMIGEEEQST